MLKKERRSYSVANTAWFIMKKTSYGMEFLHSIAMTARLMADRSNVAANNALVTCSRYKYVRRVSENKKQRHFSAPKAFDRGTRGFRTSFPYAVFFPRDSWISTWGLLSQATFITESIIRRMISLPFLSLKKYWFWHIFQRCYIITYRWRISQHCFWPLALTGHGITLCGTQIHWTIFLNFRYSFLHTCHK